MQSVLESSRPPSAPREWCASRHSSSLQTWRALEELACSALTPGAEAARARHPTLGQHPRHDAGRTRCRSTHKAALETRTSARKAHKKACRTALTENGPHTHNLKKEQPESAQRERPAGALGTVISGASASERRWCTARDQRRALDEIGEGKHRSEHSAILFLESHVLALVGPERGKSTELNTNVKRTPAIGLCRHR